MKALPLVRGQARGHLIVRVCVGALVLVMLLCLARVA